MQNWKKGRFNNSESSTQLKRCRTFYKRDVEQQFVPARQNPIYPPRWNQHQNYEYRDRQLTEQGNISYNRRHFYRRQYHDSSGCIRSSRSAASTFQSSSTTNRKAADELCLSASRASSSAALPFARPSRQMPSGHHTAGHEISSVSNQSNLNNSDHSIIDCPVSADIDEGTFCTQSTSNEVQEQGVNSKIGKPALSNERSSFHDRGLKFFSKSKHEMKTNELSVDHQDHYPRCIQIANVRSKSCECQHTQQTTQLSVPSSDLNISPEDKNSETANISSQIESGVEPGGHSATNQSRICIEEPTMEYLNHLLVEKYNLEQLTSRAEISFDDITTQSVNSNHQRDGASHKAEFGGGDGAHIDPTMVTPIFYHLARLLDLEIERIRAVVFQLSPTEPAVTCDAIQIASTEADVLEEELGVFSSDEAEELENGHKESKISSKKSVAGKPTFLVTKRIEIDVSQSINGFNFVGRILGPRGATVKQLEQQTGCKILVRGGEARKSQTGINSAPNHCSSIEPLHIIVSAESHDEISSHLRVNRASRRIRRLLTPPPDGMDDLKKRQLIELAILNGTYRIPTHLLQHATETYEKYLQRNKFSAENENTNHSTYNLPSAEPTKNNVCDDCENKSKDNITFLDKNQILCDNRFSVGEYASTSIDKSLLLPNVDSETKCTDSVPPEHCKMLINHEDHEPEMFKCENKNKDCSRTASSSSSTNDFHDAAINDLYVKRNTQAIYPNFDYADFSNHKFETCDPPQSQLWTTTLPSWPFSNETNVVNNASWPGSYSNITHPLFQHQPNNNLSISPMTYTTNIEPPATTSYNSYIAIPFPISLNCVPVYPIVSSTINGFGTTSGFDLPPPRDPTRVPSIIFINYPQNQPNTLSVSPKNVPFDPNNTTTIHDLVIEVPAAKYSDNAIVQPSLSVSTFHTSDQETHGSYDHFNTLKSQNSNCFLDVENCAVVTAYTADTSTYVIDETKYYKKEDEEVRKWLASIEQQRLELPNKMSPVTRLTQNEEMSRNIHGGASRSTFVEIKNTTSLNDVSVTESESVSHDEQQNETIVPDFLNIDSTKLQSYLFTNKPIRAEDLVSSITGKGDFENYLSERYFEESLPSKFLPNPTIGSSVPSNNSVILDLASNPTCPMNILSLMTTMNNDKFLQENCCTQSTMNYCGKFSDPEMLKVKNRMEFSHDESFGAGTNFKIRFPESSDDVRLQSNRHQINVANSRNAQLNQRFRSKVQLQNSDENPNTFMHENLENRKTTWWKQNSDT